MSTLASNAMQWEWICRGVLRIGHGETSASLVTQTECLLVTGAPSGVLLRPVHLHPEGMWFTCPKNNRTMQMKNQQVRYQKKTNSKAKS